MVSKYSDSSNTLFFIISISTVFNWILSKYLIRCISICSNYVCDIFLINCFPLIRLSDVGFIAAYLCSFIFTIYAFLKPSLFERYISLLFSSSIVNEIFGLSLSKSVGWVLLKLYLFVYVSSFDVFSLWYEMS